MPIAFAVTLVCVDLRRGSLSKGSVFRAILTVLFSLSALKVLDVWLQVNAIVSPACNHRSQELLGILVNPGRLITLSSSNLFLFSAYLGLLMLPILIVAGYRLNRVLRGRLLPWFVGGFAIVIGVLIFRFKRGSSILMPFSGNILNPSGIGPLTLGDVGLMGGVNVGQLPRQVWLPITLMSILGAALLLGFVGYCMLSGVRTNRSQPPTSGATAFLWLASLIYVAPLLISSDFDRCYVPIIPLVTASILCQSQLAGTFRSARPVIVSGTAWLMVLLFAVLSMSSTHDYFAWNRARWSAIDSLGVERQALAQRIDGGFEFNGFDGYDPHYGRSKLRSWLWVKDDKLMLAFGPKKGWKVQQEFPYQHLLPSRHGAIYLLEKAVTN